MQIMARQDYSRLDTFRFWITKQNRQGGEYQFLKRLEDYDFNSTGDKYEMPDATFILEKDDLLSFTQSLIKVLKELNGFRPESERNNAEVKAMKSHIKDLGEIAKTLVSK